MVIIFVTCGRTRPACLFVLGEVPEKIATVKNPNTRVIRRKPRLPDLNIVNLLCSKEYPRIASVSRQIQVPAKNRDGVSVVDAEADKPACPPGQQDRPDSGTAQAAWQAE